VANRAIRDEDLLKTAAFVKDQYELTEAADARKARETVELAASRLAAVRRPAISERISACRAGGRAVDWPRCAEDAAYLMAALGFGGALCEFLGDLGTGYLQSVSAMSDEELGAVFRRFVERESENKL